jgi:hypothetical protein
MKHRQVALIAAATVAVAAVTVWWEAGRVPKLASPLAVAKADALADGGSLHAELVDARGNHFAFGVTGSLDVPRDQFPAYVLRWAPVPLVRHIERGSSEERELALLARRAAADNLGNLTYAMFLLQLAETLEAKKGGHAT